MLLGKHKVEVYFVFLTRHGFAQGLRMCTSSDQTINPKLNKHPRLAADHVVHTVVEEGGGGSLRIPT